MPNGYHGPKDKWTGMERPLREVDDLLASFADQNGMNIIKNYHNWPSRTLAWGEPIVRQLSIHLASENDMLFALGMMASTDRDGGRYWKSETLSEGIPASQLRERTLDLLERGRDVVNSWTRDDLRYAGEIAET